MVLSMVTMVGFLSHAILGTMIGVLVDRWNRKLVMIGADLIIAAAGAVLSVVALTIDLPIWIVMIVLFIRSIGTAFFGVFLYANWELNVIIAIDVLGALIAFIAVSMVAIPKQMTQGEGIKCSFFEEVREGYRTIKQLKGLFALLWIGAFCTLSSISVFCFLMDMSHFGIMHRVTIHID